ncbi:MAG: C25 family cysteine peptidase, partial [Bacteroidota bacterium]
MESGIGAIALFTTVRLVYSSPNALLNKHFYENVFTFDEDKGRMPTLGEIMMRTKNKTFQRGSLANINSRNFTLLGDPGLILNYPKLRAQITHINGREVSAGQIDSLASLSKVTVSGTITDEFGTPQDTYLGDMDITVFDKPSRFTTRLSNFSFFWQKNRIFNGLSSVQDGAFDFEFIVPIDVSYEDGEGKVSLYFHNDTIDGSGCVSNLYVGGTDPNAVPDDEGPEVKLFINDTSWVSGGITDPNPFLYAIVRDENGINTVGSGIGHEISGTLDDDNANVIILNQYYTAKKDDYREGTVQYRLRDLEVGRHTLSIRVWDVANNASEASTEFIVSDNAVLALGEVLNYPNPFTEGTRFMVGHNQYGEDLELEINIYTLSGQLVHTLSSDFTATGNNYQALSWDGKTDHGRDITQGIYVYRVSLRHPATGQEKVVSKKMVVLK